MVPNHKFVLGSVPTPSRRLWSFDFVEFVLVYLFMKLNYGINILLSLPFFTLTSYILPAAKFLTNSVEPKKLVVFDAGFKGR